MDVQPLETEGPAQPFPGPAPFRIVDRTLFTGRDRDTTALLQMVIVHRGVLLYGTSGAGKSSLVNAGLIPAALQEGLTPHRIRVQPQAQGEFVVERISLRGDGGAPYLEPTLAPELTEARAVLSIADFSKALLAFAASGSYPLLVFDQFEELATLFENAPGVQGGAARGLQRAIVDCLLGILRDGQLAAKLLFVFREDYLAKVRRLLAGAPELFRAYIALDPLPVSAVKEIVQRPFRSSITTQAPSSFAPPGFERPLSEQLIENLESQFALRSRDGLLELTELQIVCAGLWAAADPPALLRKLGVQGVLEAYFDAAVDRLRKSKLRDAALALLATMVTPQGTRHVVSHYTATTTVQQSDGIPTETSARALNALLDLGLIRRDLRRDEFYFEVTSEFLAPWILARRVERDAARAQERLRTVEKTGRLKLLSMYTLPILALAAAAVLWLLQQLHGVDQLRADLANEISEHAMTHQVLATVAAETKYDNLHEGSMMLGSMMDALLGFGLIYGFLGLFCAWLLWLLTRFGSKPELLPGLERMLGVDMTRWFSGHPLLRSMGMGASPSDLPAATFVRVLVDILGEGEMPVRSNIGALDHAIQRIADPQLKELLRGFFLASVSMTRLQRAADPQESDQAALDGFWSSVAEWYERAMQRGRTQRAQRAQFNGFLVAMMLAVALNVNADAIGRYFLDSGKEAGQIARLQVAAQLLEAGNLDDALAGRAFDDYQRALGELVPPPFPLGWSTGRLNMRITSLMGMMLGWLISAVAIALSASFWLGVSERLNRTS
jgi:hypothetical protein